MSRIQISPYINFQGRAREAMEFYRSVLGGELELQTSDNQGQPRPAGPSDRITYSRLEADGAIIIGVDGHPNYPPTVGDNMAMSLGGTDRERLTEIFNRLGEGGKIKMRLMEQPGGALAGYLEDRFGINWTVTVYP